MSLFKSILYRSSESNHDGRALWKYHLTDLEFSELKSCIEQTSFNDLDPRDATLYFGEWWKRNYKGGKPKKSEVFNSLGLPKNNILTEETFYDQAKKGAEIMGIKWIRRQNTLKFRTLLLQGGLPINHISQNSSYYTKFLLRILELQPKTVDEIILNTELSSLLPVSSRNEEIYENCLAIVNSILNNEDEYKEIFEKNDELKKIGDQLNILKIKLEKNSRIIRPKFYWVMENSSRIASIFLKFGFAKQYDKETLKQLLNLVEEPNERYFQIYINDKRVCTFRRMVSGNYKTQWDIDGDFKWNCEKVLPRIYWLSENNEQNEITELISVLPTINEPSLWVPIGENEWRLVKGNSVNLDEAYVLSPIFWKHDNAGFMTKNIEINEQSLNFIHITDTIKLVNNENELSFFTNIQPFEWVILSNKPGWMANANMPVINDKINLLVYDDKEKLVSKNEYRISYKKKGIFEWQHYENSPILPLGFIDIKIEYGGKIAFDSVFNIKKLNLNFNEQNIDTARLTWENTNSLNIEVLESKKYSVELLNDEFIFKPDLINQEIPSSITFKVKSRNSRSLYFDIYSPFIGVGMLDRNDKKMKEGVKVSLSNLYGIRLLTSNRGTTNIKMWNRLRPDVIIYKSIIMSQQPLICFKEELQHLFYLADVMNYKNIIEVEVSSNSIFYSFLVKGFSNSIDNVESQLDGKVVLNDCSDLNLLAVPLNVEKENIQIFGLKYDDAGFYTLPKDIKGQFIVFSAINYGKQLQPRFFNTQPEYELTQKELRIGKYHDQLLKSDYQSMHWQTFKSYYDICIKYRIPFSTFDQIRAISFSSEVAARAFFFLGLFQHDQNEFIQLQVTSLEQDLGFCFHWIKKNDWETALDSAVNYFGSDKFAKVIELLDLHFKEIGIPQLQLFVLNGSLTGVEPVSNTFINDERSKLGERVLSELPKNTPHTTHNYGIKLESHYIVKLLLRSPIAVAESICEKSDKSIWAYDELTTLLRRNIQYVSYIAPELYKHILLHTLSMIKLN